MNRLSVVILAAGKGTRMKSKLPKVVHKICGRPMIRLVVDTAEALQPETVVAVVGYGKEHVCQAIVDIETVEQTQQLGTGHAVGCVEPLMADFRGTVLVLYGDTPLLTEETLRRLLSKHEQEGNQATILTAKLDNPTGYGRIVRDQTGRVKEIVEEKDATPEQRAIQEINTGIACYEWSALSESLSRLTNDNAQGEYYLTDVTRLLTDSKEQVGSLISGDSREVLGINSRSQLAAAEAVLRERIRRRLLREGVTMLHPASVFVDDGVTIGCDTVLYPNCIIEGETVIGEDCVIGPNVTLRNCTMGNGNTVSDSTLLDSEIASGCKIGPYAYLRPGTVLSDHSKVGTFVEVKNSTVGEGSKVPHLTYMGDADVGREANIGAGVIFVNYDGKKKHRTTVEDYGFVGCNANLVAPVTVGKSAYVAAGTTVTVDVPEKALAVGRSKQKNIEKWVEKRGLSKKEEE